MSGLSNFYQVGIADDSSFFKEMNIFTSRYQAENNHLYLFPKDIDIEINQIFIRTFLENMGARIITYEDRSNPGPNLNSYLHFVSKIDVPGVKVRAVVDQLFEQGQISKDKRSVIEDPVRELERCLLDFNSKVIEAISLAQKSILESFVEPYLEILKAKMEPWQIRESLEKSCLVVKKFADPEGSFRFMIGTMFINREPFQKTSETNPIIRVINKEWSEVTQNEVYDSLYMIAKVLTGKANLEDALLQSGAGLPNLQTQEAVIMALLQV